MDAPLTEAALLVIAKQPVPGAVKTRLSPPCTPVQAAALAGAALRDTLAVVQATPVSRRVLVFEGDPASWQPAGWTTLTQRGAGLGERLQAAFDDTFAAGPGPALLVGMDTPQLTPAHLTAVLAQLGRPGTDAVIAPTFDGGYWCVGFTTHVAGAFDGVPMSREDTYARQMDRFAELGVSVAVGDTLRDVDTMADARTVAREASGSDFARALARMQPDVRHVAA